MFLLHEYSDRKSRRTAFKNPPRWLRLVSSLGGGAAAVRSTGASVIDTMIIQCRRTCARAYPKSNAHRVAIVNSEK